MNAGQMLVQMPVGSTPAVAVQAPSTVASVPAGEQETTVFAGVLQGLSPSESARPTGSAGAAKAALAKAPLAEETEGVPVQPEIHPDAMATLLTMLEVEVKTAVPEGKTDVDALEAVGVQMSPDVQLPQNVVLSAEVPHMGAAQQINGRMPETEQKVAGKGNECLSAVRVDAQAGSSAIVPLETTPVQVPGTPLDNVKVPDEAASEKTAEAAVVAGSQKAVEKPVTVEKPLTARLKTEPQPGVAAGAVQDRTSSAASAVQQSVPTPAVPQNASPSTTVNEVPVTVTERIAAPLPRMAVSAAQTTVNADVTAVPVGNVSISSPQAEPAGSRAPYVTPQPVSISAEVRIVAGTETVQIVKAETATVKDISAVTSPPELSAATGTPPVVEITVSGAQVRPNMDAYFQTSVRPVAVPATDTAAQAAQTAVPLPVNDAPQNVHAAGDAVQRQVRGVALPQNELAAAQEQPVVRQIFTEGAAIAEDSAGNGMTGPGMESATSTSGEEFGRSGNGFGEQKMNGQAHLAMSYQVKPENVLPTAGSSAVSVPDPLRAGLAEQVVSQVREHLAGRDIKSGVEQVVIRLSPENLGELRLNLRMENQCLKVEIVAETSMVRDTLMKHADTLKESLARQNITMETFDVSTGSNRQGTPSQGQGDWRELARQRQYNAWAPTGGYKLGDMPEMPHIPRYVATSAHTMVDVHF